MELDTYLRWQAATARWQLAFKGAKVSDPELEFFLAQKRSGSEHIQTDQTVTSRGFVSNHCLRFTRIPNVPDASWFVLIAAARFSDDFLLRLS